MVTSAGPACDHCHRLFDGQPCVVAFCCSQFRYCGRLCLIAAEQERAQRLHAEEYSIQRHRTRHWKVVDGNGDLVCITLYKKGAEEVIRRLRRRKAPPFRPATGKSVAKSDTVPERPIDPIYRQKVYAKAA
jgi:hypothetical protein